jgi:4'-phosphopantetheinyl transferase
MPLIEQKTIAVDLSFYLWKIEETIEWFLENLPIEAVNRTVLEKWHFKRQLEWLSGRYLIYAITGKTTIAVDDYGKPYFLDNSAHFSVSHTNNYVALLLSQTPCGIDIQTYSPKIARIATKFINAIEEDYLIGLNQTDYTAFLHVYWSAKEAVYKAYGKKELAFKDIFITTAIVPSQKQGILLVQTKHSAMNIGNWGIFFDIKNDFVLAIAQ